MRAAWVADIVRELLWSLEGDAKAKVAFVAGVIAKSGELARLGVGRVVDGAGLHQLRSVRVGGRVRWS
jgi:hypothetical protein